MSKKRIKAWVKEFGVNGCYISFSGGKDSTVLKHLVEETIKDDPILRGVIPSVFINTGLEFPEIVDFIKSCENVTIIKPKMNFKQVLEKYGYPVVSKEQAKYIREVQNGTTKYTENKRRGMINGRNGYRVGAVSKKWQYLMDQNKIKISEQCCDVMKKRPAHKFFMKTKRVPFVGTMAGESRLRTQSYLKNACNAFYLKSAQSRPLMFWNEKDIWDYIKHYNIPYSKIYDMGYKRTGCMFCMFGCHLEKQPNRFQLMQKTHPKQWKYCMDKLGIRKVLNYINVPCENKQLEFDFMESEK